MNADSGRSSATEWTTFITGWWKFLLRAIPKPSANILTPPQLCSARGRSQGAATERSLRAVRLVALPLLLCAAMLAPFAYAQTQPAKAPAKNPPASGQTPSTSAAKKTPPKPPAAPPAASPQKLEQQLSDLSHSLEDKSSPANEEKLATFAQLHAKDEYGTMAALALGHHFLDKGHPADAIKWLDTAAKSHSRLDEYATFWHAQALRQLGRNADAVKEFDSFRQKYPESVMTDLAVQ